jgi:hypothetical protein
MQPFPEIDPNASSPRQREQLPAFLSDRFAYRLGHDVFRNRISSLCGYLQNDPEGLLASKRQD